MSVDILMYKVQALSDEELQKIFGMNVYGIDDIDRWEVKAYPLEDILENPEQFADIKPFFNKTVELMRTRTDYKACFIAHGMPKDVKSYSSQYFDWGCVVSFGEYKIRVTNEELDKYTTTRSETYCVIKRKIVDADVSNWIARSLMDELEKSVDENQDLDLSYTPIHLNAKNCETICRALVDMYDQGHLYPNDDLAQFMIELMRAIYNGDSHVFIEFQD